MPSCGRPSGRVCDLAPHDISVTLRAAGSRGLVAELADPEAPALAASEASLGAAERPGAPLSKSTP